MSVPITNHRLRPGTGDSYGHIYSWMVYDSPMSEIYPPGSTNGDKCRTIRWEEGGLYATGKKTHFLKLLKFVLGSPARVFNFHTHPGDAPDGYNQTGVDGTYKTGVSPVAADWKEGAVQNWQGQSHSGFMFVTQPNERGAYKGSPHGNRIHWPIMSDDECRAARAQQRWILFEGEITWGFADSTPPGGLRVWLWEDYTVVTDPDLGLRVLGGQRQTTPKVDAQRINTRWLNEGMVTLWEGGGYWSTGLNVEVITESAPALLGRTRDEMFADNPKPAPIPSPGWGTGTRAPAGTITYPRSGDPTPPPLQVTSSVQDGDTVSAGDPWSVTTQPVSQRVEFWADGTRITDDTDSPFQTDLNLSDGRHQLGLAVWVNGQRHVLGTDGIYATVTVIPSEPPDPIGLKIVTQDARSITLGWTPPAKQWGYVPTIDGSEKLTDGKRHIGVGATVNQVKIGKPTDGKPHRYGLKVLGVLAESSLEQ